MTEIPLTVTDAAVKLRSGELSSAELTSAVLERANKLDKQLGTYLERFDKQALSAAARADSELTAGIDRGLLHGIPIAIKDILAAKEGPTTAQSLILDRSWGEGKDATVVSRLRSAGAVITGKTTTMEFACGLPDPTKPFPMPRNPWDLNAWAGGSSSGTANGIAAGMFLAGIGTDTGGSIRGPAAFCGISGLIATFGRVPKTGCIPLGYSLDRVGPMARSAKDCAVLLQVLAGFDASDPDSSDIPVPSYLSKLGGSLEAVRVGVERTHLSQEGVDRALPGCFERAVSALQSLGATTVDVKLPYYSEMVTAVTVTWVADGLAYHRRDLKRRWADYSASSRAILAKGALMSGADYVQAQRVRRVVQEAMHRIFEQVDVIVTPTRAVGAPSYAEVESASRNLSALSKFAFMSYWNGIGSPALVVPMGFTERGLPLSLQIAGRPFEESLILTVGDAYQGITDWHLRVAPLVQQAQTAMPSSRADP